MGPFISAEKVQFFYSDQNTVTCNDDHCFSLNSLWKRRSLRCNCKKKPKCMLGSVVLLANCAAYCELTKKSPAKPCRLSHDIGQI